MEQHTPLSQVNQNDRIEGYYILKNALPKVGSNGKPFLSAVFADKSGELDGKVWNYSGPVDQRDEGRVVWLQASVTEFKGTLQLSVEKLRLAEEGEPWAAADLVPTAPIDPEEILAKIRALIASLEDPDYRAVCETMLARHKDTFRTLPAGKSVHHAFLGGLLMHTWNMLQAANFFGGLYGDLVDRSLLLAGTFLHDFGKEREFSCSELGLVAAYSTQGQLLGHLVMGAQEAAETARELGIPEEKSVLLQHLILSHHGEPEFGAAVLPACVEAELLAAIDRLDSRVEIYRETLAELEPGTFSKRLFALEKRVYRHR